MSIETVGFGNLPNIYFEKITLEDHDEKSFKIITHLTVLDQLDESSFVWSSDALFSGFMKIAIIATSNPIMAEELTNGDNVHPTMLKQSLNWNDQSTLSTYGFGDLSKSEDIDD